MSAQELREAAALMRSRAEAAVQPINSPSWIIDHKDPFASPHEVYRGPVGAGDVARADDAPTAEHIASWHPAVALAVADWLDDQLDAFLSARPGSHLSTQRALTVARAYLGTANA